MEEAAKKASATNKLLHAAIYHDAMTTVALGTTLDITILPNTAGRFTVSNTAPAEAIVLKAGADVTALKGWKGKDYKVADGKDDAKRTTEARIYHNQGAPKTGQTLQNSDFGGAATITADNKGVVTIAAMTPDADTKKLVKLTAFSSGTTTLSEDQKKSQPGSINGIAGTFSCTGECTVKSEAAGTTLSGTWTFKTSATASRPDTDYLYFGWWVHKDDKDEPLAASAFAVRQGTDNTKIAPVSSGLNGLGGSATYEGAAAGKYADLNQRMGTATGGHFTADAMLKAVFESDDEGGIEGTINNFRLNDETANPGWSIALSKTGDDFATAGHAPVWSIGDNKGKAAGSWSVSLYDERPGNAPDGDGSTIPTTATGTFHSEFGSDLKMVGAFGANKQ